jgi:hypothetical protein
MGTPLKAYNMTQLIQIHQLNLEEKPKHTQTY